MSKVKKVKCTNCHGRGKISVVATRNKICNSCGGTGRNRGSYLIDGSKPCSNCNGRGRVYGSTYKRCGSCRGKGYMEFIKSSL